MKSTSNILPNPPKYKRTSKMFWSPPALLQNRKKGKNSRQHKMEILSEMKAASLPSV